MDFTKILTLALTIAVAFLVYDRFLKPVGRVLIPAGGGKTMTIEEQLEKEGF